MGEKLLAGIGLVACMAVLLGMLAGPKRVADLRASLLRLWGWPQRRRTASRESKQAIERARRAVQRDGNVYRPESFNQPPPDDKLH